MKVELEKIKINKLLVFGVLAWILVNLTDDYFIKFVVLVFVAILFYRVFKQLVGECEEENG